MTGLLPFHGQLSLSWSMQGRAEARKRGWNSSGLTSPHNPRVATFPKGTGWKYEKATQEGWGCSSLCRALA